MTQDKNFGPTFMYGGGETGLNDVGTESRTRIENRSDSDAPPTKVWASYAEGICCFRALDIAKKKPRSTCWRGFFDG